MMSTETPTLNLDDDPLITEQDVSAWLNAFGTVRGDTNLDRRVDATDLNVVGLNWQNRGELGWGGGDFNGDNVVDAMDLNDVGVSWEFGLATAASPVPEPRGAILWLALFGFLYPL